MSYVGNPHPDQPFSIASGQTITGYQVVIPNTNPTNPDDLECKVSDAADTFPLGIAQVDDNVALTEGTIAVRTYGVSKAIAGGAITIGAQVSGDATGHVYAGTPGAAHWYVGVALTSAAALGDEVLIFVKQEMNEA